MIHTKCMCIRLEICNPVISRMKRGREGKNGSAEKKSDTNGIFAVAHSGTVRTQSASDSVPVFHGCCNGR